MFLVFSVVIYSGVHCNGVRVEKKHWFKYLLHKVVDVGKKNPGAAPAPPEREMSDEEEEEKKKKSAEKRQSAIIKDSVSVLRGGTVCCSEPFRSKDRNRDTLFWRALFCCVDQYAHTDVHTKLTYVY